MTASEEEKGLKDLILVTGKLVYRQLDIQGTRAKKDIFYLLIIIKVWKKENIRSRVIWVFLDIRLFIGNEDLVPEREETFPSWL